MQKSLNRLISILLVTFCLGISTQVFAKAVFNIYPNLSSVQITSTGSSSISYSVTNNTNHTINQLTINPSYDSTGNLASIFLQKDNCSGTTLAPNGNCTFQILLSGANQPSIFQLRPRVCGFNGLICSLPLGENEVQVNVQAATPTTPTGVTPSVTSVNPSATSVSTTTSLITLTFSTLMSAATINSSTVSMVQDGTSTNLISSCTAGSNTSTFYCSFSTALTSNTKYDIAISTGAQTTGGVALGQAYSTYFLTAALIAGDGTTHTYYVTSSNTVTISSSGANFTGVTYSSGSPTGTVDLLAGDGAGRMYFATSTNQIWENSAGGGFSQATFSGGSPTGNIVVLNGDGSGGNMYFATSTGQLWGNSAGGAFSQQTFAGGTPTGSIVQIDGDGVQYACVLTSTSQVFCAFFGSAFTQITYSGGALSGNIIRLVGIVNASAPIDISFYTTSNQLFQQVTPGTTSFKLATYSGGTPTGIIQQMASDGNGKLYFATTTNQVWENNGGAFSQFPVTGGSISGLVSLMSGNNGYVYLATSSNQLFQTSGTSFTPITVGFSGAISQFSGSGGYMYFVTLASQTWFNLNGDTYAQVTHP